MNRPMDNDNSSSVHKPWLSFLSLTYVYEASYPMKNECNQASLEREKKLYDAGKVNALII
jgi:hypothetical protein